MFDLTDKTALITGASGGIGRAIALALAQQGADVALHFHNGEEAANEVAAEVRKLGRKATVQVADARESEQLTTLWKTSESELGKIDILVNNAGLMKSSFLAMTSEDSWDEVLDVNLKAAFWLSKMAARSMSRRKCGRIINISSRAGEMGHVMHASYAAAKAGVLGLTKATARELAVSGITCNAVTPGFIETAMATSDEAKREAQCKLIPVGRFGTPQEVAALTVYLASEEAAYVTGQAFGIDGGLRM